VSSPDPKQKSPAVTVERGDGPRVPTASNRYVAERRLVRGIVVGAATAALAVIAIGIIKIQADKRSVRADLQATRERFASLIHVGKAKTASFDFGGAMAALAAAEQLLKQTGYSGDDLHDRLYAAQSGLAEEERTHNDKLARGYRLVRGKLLSPSEQGRLTEIERRRIVEAERRRKSDKARGRRQETERQRLADLAAREAAIRDSWVQYMGLCGIKAQEVNGARSKKAFRDNHEGISVTWCGSVHHIDDRVWAEGFAVEIKMNPTESYGSDITLLLPTPFEDLVMSLNAGDPVEFTAIIQEQGNSVKNHRLAVQSIKKK